jgi:hypothetical protein
MFIAPKKYRFTFRGRKENLYLKLIEQINKDFNLANEPIDFHSSTKPQRIKLKKQQKKIYRLIQYKFAEYLNLLYNRCIRRR